MSRGTEGTTTERNRKLFFLLIAMTAAVLAALLAKTKIDRYVAEDPKFCQTCHEVRPGVAMWASDSHSRITCQACHAIDQEQMQAMLVATVTGSKDTAHPKLDPSHIRCEACHLTADHKKKPVMSSPGHQQHTKSVKVSCLQCHGSRVHRIVKPETVCKSCHEEVVNKADRMNEVHCQTCHNFLDPSATILPSRKDCQDCHDRQRVKQPEFPANGHMEKLPCFVCHEPHVAADPGDACTTCHVRTRESHEHRRHSLEKCQSCHAPHGFQEAPDLCSSHHHEGALTPAFDRPQWTFEELDAPRDWESLRPTWTSSISEKIKAKKKARAREPSP